MSKMWQAFKEGFVGSFVLAGAIVMAIISVASAFANGTLNSHGHQNRENGHTQI